MSTLQVPFDQNQSPVFPDRCVGCGGKKEAESQVQIERLIPRGKTQKQITLKYLIPHCSVCARSTKAVFLAGCIPFVVGFLIFGVAAFLVVGLGAMQRGLDDYGQPGNSNSLVLGAAAGLFAGLVGGFLSELVSRVLLIPFFGSSLIKAPLLATQFLKDSDYVAGLSIGLDRTASTVTLEFANEEIAREFAALNHKRARST